MHDNPAPVDIAPVDQIMLLDSERLRDTLRPDLDMITHSFMGTAACI
ncbi:hypothetical protein [Puniceibacterium sediminis]|nr:hypothetical protein [Puniceibacterium sediminis]